MQHKTLGDRGPHTLPAFCNRRLLLADHDRLDEDGHGRVLLGCVSAIPSHEVLEHGFNVITTEL